MENKLTLNTLPYHYKDMVNLEYELSYEDEYRRYYESKINVLLLFKSDDDVVIPSIGHFAKTIAVQSVDKHVNYTFVANNPYDLSNKEDFNEDLEFSFIEIEGRVVSHVENLRRFANCFKDNRI